MSDVVGRVRQIQERIARAAERAGRRPESVTLLAVTKTIPLESILPVIEAGIQHIGENRVQEALQKYASGPLAHGNVGEGQGEGKTAVPSSPPSPAASVGRRSPVFHLIGPLQTNKAKKAVEFFDVIQTLDRLELAESLNRHADAAGKTLKCLVEVKISPESTKAGLAPDAVPQFLDQLKAFPRLNVRGLMGIPPLDAAGDRARPYFQTLRRLYEQVPDFDTLSMGMSSDFETAIEEGATLVRIGSALFGTRNRL